MGFKNRPFAAPSDTRIDKIDLVNLPSGPTIIATTSTTDLYFMSNCDFKVEAIKVAGSATLTADNTNYVTWTLTNLGTGGAGTTVMLSTADTNTTKATGGSTLTLIVPRTLVLTATDASLKVKAGELIRLRTTATGTLANTVPTFTAWLTGANVLYK